MRGSSLLPLFLSLGLLIAAPASGDPRWWWDDVPLTADGLEKALPHLTLAGAGDPGGGQAALFAVWQQRDPLGGDWEVYLTGSSDNGCSFCPPVRVTDTGTDDTRPRIAVATIPGPNQPYSIQIVYEEEGDVILASDAQTVSAFSTGTVFCREMAALEGAFTRKRLNTTPGAARRPDISVSTLAFAFSHFHAVWEEDTAGVTDIWTDRDLAGDGTGYGAPGFPLNLTPHALPAGDAVMPAVSGDTLGAAAGTDGGVSVAFLDETSGELLYLRSADSGGGWSGSGAPPAGPPVDPPLMVTSSAPMAGGSEAPSLADSDSSFGSGQAWIMAGWARTDGSGAAVDAEHRSAPATVDVPWRGGAGYDTGPAALSGGRSALSLEPGLGGNSGAWLMWPGQAAGFQEILHRAGTLNPAAALPVDFDLYPFPPQRPRDTQASAPSQLSHCVFDEAAWNCPSTRVAGAAGQPSATSGGDFSRDQHLLWIDTRSGFTEVFYKRTDTFSSAASVPPLTTECASPAEGRIRGVINPPITCSGPFANPEKIRRYLVYYGTDPGGVYANAGAPVVIEDDGASAFPFQIDGLSLSTTWHVLVVTEDEARNTFPPDFDPAEDRASWTGELSLATPDASECRPQVSVVSCSLGGESCPEPRPGDGQIDPGETFEVTITFENTGKLEAVGFEADFSAAGASVNLPPGGALSIPSIPSGERVRTVVSATVDQLSPPAFECGDTVDLHLAGLRATNGGPWPDDMLVACDFPVGGGDAICQDCAPSPNVLVTSCRLLDDACSGRPADGVVDPGEQALLEVEFHNAGTVPALDFEAEVRAVWGGTLAAGFPPVGPVDIAAGGSIAHAFGVDVGEFCGDLLDIDIESLVSDGGAWNYPDAPDACDRTIGANPRPRNRLHRTDHAVTIPDDGTEVRNPVPVETEEPIRVGRAVLRVVGNMPAPADVRLRLEGPGGPPGMDVSPAWNGQMDITDLYNVPGAGGPGDWFLHARDNDTGAPGGDGGQWSATIEIDDTLADCDPCPAAPTICLYAVRVDDREDFNDRKPAGFFLDPPGPGDLHLDGPPFACSFQPGDRVPGVVPEDLPLAFYGLDVPARDMRLTKDVAFPPGDLVVTWTP